MAIAGDMPPRYGNIETRCLSYREESRPGGLSYRNALRPGPPTDTSLFLPYRGGCHRDVGRLRMQTCNNHYYYSFLSASIGGSDAAFKAGYNPQRIPIAEENATEISSHCACLLASVFCHGRGMWAGNLPGSVITITSPPASFRNCLSLLTPASF